MKRTMLFLVVVFNCFCVNAQSEYFDIARYIPPQQWKKEMLNGALSLTHLDETKNSFCALLLYPSMKSQGDAVKDFMSQWKKLAVERYKVTARPVLEKKTTADGWKIIAAGSLVKIEDADCLFVVSVFSGFGKLLTVTCTTNDTAYLPTVDEFLETMQLEKNETSAEAANRSQSNSSKVSAGTGVVASSKASDENSFGKMHFQPIAGWKMERFSDAIAFTPKDLPPNRYLETRILPAKNFSGTIEEALAQSWNDALQQFQLVSPFTPPYFTLTKKTSYKGWNYIRCEGTVKSIHDQSELGYDKYYIHLFVIQVNGRIERFATVGLSNIEGADYSPYNNGYYSEPIEELYYSVEFDDWKDSISTVVPRTPLKGMYQGLRLGANGLSGSFVIFFPNGQVFFGSKFPTEGFAEKNTWLLAEKNTHDWGIYRLNNGVGSINMGNGNFPLKISGKNLFITTQNTEHVYEPVPSIDGAMINGSYGFADDSGKISSLISFTPDGKFVDEGALNILNHQTTSPDEFNIAHSPGNGTYEIKNYTIIFHYSDGRKLQIVFKGEGFDKKNPGPPSLTLSFNNDILYKK